MLSMTKLIISKQVYKFTHLRMTLKAYKVNIYEYEYGRKFKRLK